MSIRTLAAALAVVALPTLASAGSPAAGVPAVEKHFPDGKPADGHLPRRSAVDKMVRGAVPSADAQAQEDETIEEIRPERAPRDGRPGRTFAGDKTAGEKIAQGTMPSAQQIERQLEAAPRKRVRPEERVTIREFKKRPELRRNAPAIDIQSINFAFGSAEIPYSQFGKIENIADAIERILRRDRRQVFLVEGHTDAVGSWGSNQRLSEARAASLKSVLVNEFGIPRRALETVGYGEEYLLVPTQDENWRNRRVTLRRITDQIVPF